MKMNVSLMTGHVLDWMAAKAVCLEMEPGLICCGCGVQTSHNSPPECCGSPILAPFYPGSSVQYQPSAGPQDIEHLREIVRRNLGAIVDVPDEIL